MNIQVEEFVLPQVTPFGTAYNDDFERVSSFFHYSPFEVEEYRKRVEELSQRTFNRKELAFVIRSYVTKWGIHEQQEKQVRKFELPNSVAIIGGQQAGILMGPLYTLHKILTILQLAQQKEAELDVPVVPIFWIAGEDHDWLEVNHVYTPKAEGVLLERLTFHDSSSVNERVSLTHRLLPKEDLLEWIDQFFTIQYETEFTNELRTNIYAFIHESHTYVDFFAQLLQYLFAQYGLLMIDSGDPELRRLESSVFAEIIENYDLIDEEVRKGIQRMEDHAYPAQVKLGEHPALLFIYEKNQRLLLEKIGDRFQTKNGEYHYSINDLLHIASNEPWRLSNNVITRPFMQEKLFPTLAFVGGPGEIAYWALYKSYFEQLEVKMPILAPRISITIIENPISRIMEKRQLDVDTIYGDFAAYRTKWLKEQDDIGLGASFTEAKRQIQDVYAPLLEKIIQARLGLDGLGHQNLGKIVEQVDFFEKRSLAAFSAQHEATLRQFDKVEQALYPHGKPQERLHNTFTFLNKHGMVVVKKLMEYPLSVNGKHKLIYIK